MSESLPEGILPLEAAARAYLAADKHAAETNTEESAQLAIQALARMAASITEHGCRCWLVATAEHVVAATAARGLAAALRDNTKVQSEIAALTHRHDYVGACLAEIKAELARGLDAQEMTVARQQVNAHGGRS